MGNQITDVQQKNVLDQEKQICYMLLNVPFNDSLFIAVQTHSFLLEII